MLHVVTEVAVTRIVIWSHQTLSSLFVSEYVRHIFVVLIRCRKIWSFCEWYRYKDFTSICFITSLLFFLVFCYQTFLFCIWLLPFLVKSHSWILMQHIQVIMPLHTSSQYIKIYIWRDLKILSYMHLQLIIHEVMSRNIWPFYYAFYYIKVSYCKYVQTVLLRKLKSI